MENFLFIHKIKSVIPALLKNMNQTTTLIKRTHFRLNKTDIVELPKDYTGLGRNYFHGRNKKGFT